MSQSQSKTTHIFFSENGVCVTQGRHHVLLDRPNRPLLVVRFCSWQTLPYRLSAVTLLHSHVTCFGKGNVPVNVQETG